MRSLPERPLGTTPAATIGRPLLSLAPASSYTRHLNGSTPAAARKRGPLITRGTWRRAVVAARRRALLGVGAAVAIGLAGCGVGTSGVISGLPAPSGSVRVPPGITLYLVSASGPVPVQRILGPRMSAADVLALLVAGPNSQERADGLRTAVPADAAPFRVSGDTSGRITVTIAISPDQLPAVAVTQIVYTVCADDGRGGGRGPVVVLGHGGTTGPRSCPVGG